MQKSCRQCNTTFEVTQDDLAFYERIGVPPPTLCPDCRLQRRMALRNDRMLHRRSCDLCKKEIIAIDRAGSAYPVYCPSCWWSDAWDPLSFGRAFDFRRPFFEQYSDLMCTVPHISLHCEQSENCDYCQNTTFSRNCYLCSACFRGEDCAYTFVTAQCRNVLETLSSSDCERCYELLACRRCYGSCFLQNCSDCTDCALCFDCQGCRNCIGCMNLRNAENRFFNQPATPDDIRAFHTSLRSYRNIENAKQEFAELKATLPHRANHFTRTENCTGDHISNSKNCTDCFDIEECEDCASSDFAKKLKDSRDVFGALMGGDLQYENSSAGGGINVQFAFLSWHNADSRYMKYCLNSQNLFGCIGLRHKQYCILNTQYTKEEYEALITKIIEHMQRAEEWGEFFPITISPYAYNETLAQEFFPLTKEEVMRRGWKWREEHDEVPKVEKIFDAALLPDSIADTPDDILNWAMYCSVTKRPYRIQKTELAFYRSMGLPIPRKHPDERRRERMARRNPRKLFARACAKCGREIQTTYPPSRPEQVFCESCYLKAVY